MGGAILAGLSSGGVDIDGPVRVTTKSAESAERLVGLGHDAVSLASVPDANRRAVQGARIVLLGVKPVGIADLAAEIADALEPDAVVVSIAAGVPIAAIERVLRPGAAVVRAMPNTPATIGLGATGVSAGSSVTAEQMELARSIFETVGSVHEVPESQIDAVTAISGSGPAYLFYFAESLTKAGIELGLPAALAEALSVQTVRGAGELLARSDFGAVELRRRVTSPGGTTAKALAVLEQQGLPATLADATRAARSRATELAAQFDGPTEKS